MFYRSSVGANPGKRDAWPRPRRTRHVWVRATGKQHPRQGVVLAWRRTVTGWEAWVVFVDESKREPSLVQRWVDVRQLSAVWSDPNATGW
jgi:hypothetical protein